MSSVGQMLPSGVLKSTFTLCWAKTVRSSSEGVSGPLLWNFAPSVVSPEIDPFVLSQSIDLSWLFVASDSTSEYDFDCESSVDSDDVSSRPNTTTASSAHNDQRGSPRSDGPAAPRGSRGGGGGGGVWGLIRRHATSWTGSSHAGH